MAAPAPGRVAAGRETPGAPDLENPAASLANGGEQFTYLPGLHASDLGLRVIEAVVRRELMGWIREAP